MATQVTWRAEDWLVEDVKFWANRRGISMNEFLTVLAKLGTDASYRPEGWEDVIAVLDRAGMLANPVTNAPRPIRDEKKFAEVRKRAGQGTPLSDIVIANREEGY